MSTPDPEFGQLMSTHFANAIPHVGALGIEILETRPEAVLARLIIRPELIGDTERGLVHTGVLTSLIDSACGLAMFARIGQRDTIATLDLRVDYLRPTLASLKVIHCRAECYRLTGQIAFSRATLWQQDEAEPVATSLGTFMRASSSKARAP